MAHPKTPSELPTHDEETVSSLLRSKRKARAVKSCFPCRHRRVRCDGGSPCSSCVGRDHPELCQRQAGAARSDAAHVPISTPEAPGSNLAERNLIVAHHEHEDPDLVIQRLETIEEQITSIKADLKQRSKERLVATSATFGSGQILSKPPGQHCIERDTGARIFLGSYADPPSALGLMSMMSPGNVLGALTPRTYAFTNLWAPEVGLEEVCKTLPEDRDMIR